jgi:hypothetical protein
MSSSSGRLAGVDASATAPGVAGVDGWTRSPRGPRMSSSPRARCHAGGAELDEASALIARASSRSLLVMPPASCVARWMRTVP